MADEKRFTVTIDCRLYERLLDVTVRRKPRLPKRYVVELALTRLLDQAGTGQLELGLDVDDRPKR